MNQLRVSLCGLLLVSALALAQAETGAAAPPPPAETGAAAPPPPAEVPAPVPVAEAAPASAPSWSDAVTIGGLVDGYFGFRLQGDARAPIELRTFDGNAGTFTPAYVEVNATVSTEYAGARLDLGFGPVADATSLEPTTPPTSEIFKNIQQAYATFKLPVGRGLTIDFGKFVTSSGAEVIEAKDNFLYTRSMLFGWAIAFTHTGLRLGLPLTDELTLQGGLLNGWDVVNDNNKYKSINLSVTYAGKSGLTAILNYYGGAEGESSDWRHLVDVVVNYAVGESLTLNLNGDFAVDGPTSWYGASLMARYLVSEHLKLALRAEYFNDPDGARTLTTGGLSTTGFTLGAAFPFGSNAELRAEVRQDLASQQVYVGGTSTGQTTLHLAALAWF